MGKDNIEQLLSDAFDDYAVPEFKNSWSAIKSKVFRKQFFKFKIYQFNAYYAIVAVATMIGAGILFFSPLESEKARPVPVEMEDVLEEPMADDTISSEEILEVVPELSQKDTLGDKAEEVSSMRERSVVPEKEAEVHNDLKTEPVSFHESDEGNMDTRKSGVEVLEQDTLTRVVENNASKLERPTPIVPIDSIAIEQDLDSSSVDDLEGASKKIIIVEPPVVKRDTVVKVIRERRRR